MPPEVWIQTLIGILMLVVAWVVNRLVKGVDKLAEKIETMDSQFNKKVGLIAEDKVEVGILKHLEDKH